MLLFFWRGLLGALAPPSSTATAQAETATFVTVRQAVFGAATATATAQADAPVIGIFATLPAETATADAQAPVGALVNVVPVGPPVVVPAGAANFTATNAATLSVPLPPGWLPDDIHVLWAHRSDNTAMTALAGWTQIASLSGNNTTAQRVEVWIRRAQAGDTNPVIVTFGSSTIVRGAKIVGVRGCPTTGLATDQIDVSGRSLNAVADLTIEFPSITTTDVNRLVLLLAAFEDDPVTVTTPTGFTAPATSNEGSSLGNDMSLLHWYQPVLTPQTVSPSVSTVSGGGVGSSPSVGIAIAFKGLLIPAGSVTLPAVLPTGAATAPSGVFYAEAGNVAILGQRATATVAGGVAGLLGGAVAAMTTAPSSAAGTTATLTGSVILSAPVATGDAAAPSSAMLFGASLPGALTTATATSATPVLLGAATLGAPVATGTASASAAAFLAGTSLPAQVATATAASAPVALLAVRQALFAGQTATGTGAGIPAALVISGSVLGQTATADAQAPVGALHVVVPAGVPTLVGLGGAAFTATNAATLSLTLPPSWQPDDIHVLWAHRSDNTAMTALAGWTQIAALSGDNTTAQRVEVWVRRAVAGDANPVIVTFGSGTIVRGGRIVGIRGCPPTGPATDAIDVQGRANSPADMTIEVPPLTTTGPNRFMTLMTAFEDDPNTAVPPVGFTFIGAYGAASNLGNGMALLFMHRDVATAQTVTPEAIAVSGGGSSASPSVGISIAFRGLLVPAGSVTFPAVLPTASATAPVGVLVQSGGVQLVAPTATATSTGPAATLLGSGLMGAPTATATASSQIALPSGKAAILAQVATATSVTPTAALVFGAVVPSQVAPATASAASFSVVTGALVAAQTATASADAAPMQAAGGVSLVAPVAVGVASATPFAFLAGAVLDGALATAVGTGGTAILLGSVQVVAGVATATALAPTVAFGVGGVAILGVALATATAYDALVGVRAVLVVPGTAATADAPVAAILATVSVRFLSGHALAFADGVPPDFVAIRQAIMAAIPAPAAAGSAPITFLVLAIVTGEVAGATGAAQIGVFIGSYWLLMPTATATAAAAPVAFTFFAILDGETARAGARAPSIRFVGLFPTVVLRMTVSGYGTVVLEPTAYGMVSLTVTGQEAPLMGISRDP